MYISFHLIVINFVLHIGCNKNIEFPNNRRRYRSLVHHAEGGYNKLSPAWEQLTKEVHSVEMVWVEDAQDPFYLEEDVKAESDGRREQVTPLTLVETASTKS